MTSSVLRIWSRSSNWQFVARPPSNAPAISGHRSESEAVGESQKALRDELGQPPPCWHLPTAPSQWSGETHVSPAAHEMLVDPPHSSPRARFPGPESDRRQLRSSGVGGGGPGLTTGGSDPECDSQPAMSGSASQSPSASANGQCRASNEKKARREIVFIGPSYRFVVASTTTARRSRESGCDAVRRDASKTRRRRPPWGRLSVAFPGKTSRVRRSGQRRSGGACLVR